MYCKHCGEDLPEGSTFCPSCGNRLGGGYAGAPPKKTVTTSPMASEGTPQFVKQPTTYTSAETSMPRYTKSSSTNWVPICLGIIIVIFIGFVIIVALIVAILLLFFPLAANYTIPYHLGTEVFSIPTDSSRTNLNLDFTVGAGLIQMDVGTSSMGDSIYVTQEVWTAKRDISYDTSQVANFVGSTTDNTTTLTFNAFEGSEDYYYMLYVTVHPDIALGLDMSTVAGSISFESYEEITLTALNLETGAGSIDLGLYQTTHLQFTSGTIFANAGSIDLTSNNFNLAQDSTLDLTTNAGSINATLNQVIDFNQSLNINANANAGSINIDAYYANSIGLSVTTETNAGSADISGLINGFTDNYSWATTHIDFDLKTSAGSINFSAAEL
ncbi:MAG: zinc-ribbon domain-containing protein [Candidatus Hodarchaeota archaeon]